jgi:predicted histidine transporter YuiF (NhaC family)
VDIGAEKEKDRESRGKVRIETPKTSTSKNSRHEKTYFVLVSIFLAAILFYTLYNGELLWGIVIDILILRLYFLMRRERRYFSESDQNEEEAGTPHDPKMKRRVWIANMLITLFVLGLVIYSYFTFQFIWGVVAGLLVLLYVHMLLFSGENL